MRKSKLTRSEVLWFSYSIGILAIVLGFFGLKIYSKIDLCKTYYSEMSRLTCFMSNSTLPQRNNR
jgi:hypothetical protein